MSRAVMARTGVALAGAVLAIACGREATSDATAIATWSVDSQPMLTIGRDASAEGGVILERVTGATRLPDGQLLVADLGDAPLRLFGADGKLVRLVARKGLGPGEIEYLARLFRCGDAVYTYDIEGYRISEFGVDATYRRVFRFEVPPNQQTPYASACNASGRFVHLGWGAGGARTAGYHRDTVSVWTSATADGTPTIIDSVPSSERWGQTVQGRIVGSMPLPLGKQPTVAYGPDGFFVGTGDGFGILAYDASGALRDTLRLADSVPAVTPADVRDYIERLIAEAGERNRAGIEREYAAITFPTTHSAVAALLVDSDGLVWMRAYTAPTSATATWTVVDAEGRTRARVALPRGLQVFEIGRDYVLGRQLDATEGVPVVSLLRLNRDAR